MEVVLERKRYQVAVQLSISIDMYIEPPDERSPYLEVGAGACGTYVLGRHQFYHLRIRAEINVIANAPRRGSLRVRSLEMNIIYLQIADPAPSVPVHAENDDAGAFGGNGNVTKAENKPAVVPRPFIGADDARKAVLAVALHVGANEDVFARGAPGPGEAQEGAVAPGEEGGCPPRDVEEADRLAERDAAKRGRGVRL